MKRIHAFEFEDLSWFPKRLRNYGTDFLEAVANAFDMYKVVMPIVVEGIRSSGNETIIDMGSGGGGGMVKIAERLKKDIPSIRIVLTDYFPNSTAFERTRATQPDVFDYTPYPVDAKAMPSALKGFRTQFLSFHHFRPADAKAIIQNAVDDRQPIGIFEAQQRNCKNILQRFFSPLLVLLLTPFIKPITLGRILFTYLLPVVPLFVLWDGIVSVLRAYTVAELKEMIAALNNHHLFHWEVDTIKDGANSITYLLGLPKK